MSGRHIKRVVACGRHDPDPPQRAEGMKNVNERQSALRSATNVRGEGARGQTVAAASNTSSILYLLFLPAVLSSHFMVR